MKTTKIPNPEYIKMYMEDGKTKLVDFDDYLHPGVAGKIFHSYSAEFTKKLAAVGIVTFKQLKEEFERCQNKKSGLSKSLRIIVQGHYTYYMNELKASEAVWNTLSPENYQKAKDHDYLVMKDPGDSDESKLEEYINETQD